MADSPFRSDPAASKRAEDPATAWRAALKRYEPTRLCSILHALGREDDRSPKASVLADRIADVLTEPENLEPIRESLGTGPRLVLGLASFTETFTFPAPGLAHTLRALGLNPASAVEPLLNVGLAAARRGDASQDPIPFDGLFDKDVASSAIDILVAPSAVSVAPTIVPDGAELPVAGTAGQIREADGLEPIVRLAALWQRLVDAPLRQTQQRLLYKRDRERLHEDPVLAGPISDALEPLPDMVPLWLSLARRIGLVADEPGTDRVIAAPAEFWSEHAFHLPQMLAVSWLTLSNWHELAGFQDVDGAGRLALPFARPAVMLWLASKPEGAWVALDDLASHLRSVSPDWDRLALELPPQSALTGRKGPRGRTSDSVADTQGVLRAMLLGPAYQLGLVRSAREIPGGRELVQITPLGRYVLALAPPPPPRPEFSHFLFVQPNFEVIAYRQGLNPFLIGLFSQFLTWSQLGAALEMKLTADSVYRGLECGLTLDRMLERLQRHSARPLPAGVAEALRTWTQRRERIVFHSSATLIEFASADDLESALEDWSTTNGDGERPTKLTDRLLLVVDETGIPFHRFRISGSRDYRRESEPCVEVEPDGITLAVDLTRSDLFIDAELARLADPIPLERRTNPGELPRRRYRISTDSIARAFDEGLTPNEIEHWFEQRTGEPCPAATRLLIHAASASPEPIVATRLLVLRVSRPDLIEGLLQHPLTRDYLGERLGPTTVVVPEFALEGLRRALDPLGLKVEWNDAS